MWKFFVGVFVGSLLRAQHPDVMTGASMIAMVVVILITVATHFLTSRRQGTRRA